jgi:dsRNA-specific ribonuclease
LKIVYFFRVHEETSNPKMKFMTKIKLNDHVVSKGFGQNKKSSKTAAA